MERVGSGPWRPLAIGRGVVFGGGADEDPGGVCKYIVSIVLL